MPFWNAKGIHLKMNTLQQASEKPFYELSTRQSVALHRPYMARHKNSRRQPLCEVKTHISATVTLTDVKKQTLIGKNTLISAWRYKILSYLCIT